MIPMISTKEEILTIKKLLKEIKNQLDLEQKPYGNQLGIMIEVPSAYDCRSTKKLFFSRLTMIYSISDEPICQLFISLHPP